MANSYSGGNSYTQDARDKAQSLIYDLGDVLDRYINSATGVAQRGNEQLAQSELPDQMPLNSQTAGAFSNQNYGSAIAANRELSNFRSALDATSQAARNAGRFSTDERIRLAQAQRSLSPGGGGVVGAAPTNQKIDIYGRIPEKSFLGKLGDFGVRTNLETAARRGFSEAQSAGQVQVEKARGKEARELAKIQAQAQLGATGLQTQAQIRAAELGAQGNIIGSLFSSLGTSSPNYRYWG